LKLKEGGEKWVDFKFERLPNLCYHCEKIGHEMRMCDAHKKIENFFGHWMRAETREMSPMFSEYEKRWEMRRRTETQRLPLADLTNWKDQTVETTLEGLADNQQPQKIKWVKDNRPFLNPKGSASLLEQNGVASKDHESGKRDGSLHEDCNAAKRMRESEAPVAQPSSLALKEDDIIFNIGHDPTPQSKKHIKVKRQVTTPQKGTTESSKSQEGGVDLTTLAEEAGLIMPQRAP